SGRAASSNPPLRSNASRACPTCALKSADLGLKPEIGGGGPPERAQRASGGGGGMCSFRLSTCLFVSRKQRTWMFNQAPHHAEHAPSTAAIAAVPLRRYAALRDRRYFAGAGVRRPARMRL